MKDLKKLNILIITVIFDEQMTDSTKEKNSFLGANVSKLS